METCVLDVKLKTRNKIYLYVTFPPIFAHNLRISAKFAVKIVLMFAQYFEYYAIILRGQLFCGHAVYVHFVRIFEMIWRWCM